MRDKAVPTARAAPGDFTMRDNSPYVRVSPKGTFLAASQTFRWNAVPSQSTGMSNDLRFPAKYS